MKNINDVENFWNKTPLWFGESKFEVGEKSFFLEHRETVINDCFAGNFDERLLPKDYEDSVLDLGCGNGVLTKKILRSTKNVIGIDSSDAMVRAAKKIGIDSYLIDGEAIPFRNVFDAVFSNAALHWIQNQDAVLRGVHQCLKPKGRFVGEFGGHGNISCLIAIIETVMKAKPFSCSFNNPWYFPSTDEFSKKLSAHNFSIQNISLISRPTFLPSKHNKYFPKTSFQVIQAIN